MGRRKLRFDQRKNFERRKARAATLTVSIPLHLYKTLPASSTIALLTRLRETGSLTNGWTTTDVPEDDPSCVMFKMSFHKKLPIILFTLTINHDSTWTLMVCDSKVDTDRCSLFTDVPPYLRSVADVLDLLLKLDTSKFCTGNKETRFLELATASGGVFKDKRGTVYII